MSYLLEQFNQYFQIEHAISVNLEPVDEANLPNDDSDIDKIIPPLFLLANEVNILEQTALRPLRQLGDVAEDLAQYLKLQSRKIDLILSHILASENQQEDQLETHSFGGSGFVLNTTVQYQANAFYRCKLFLADEAAAVFCFAQVVDSQSVEGNFITRFIFSHIREQDQELMVRASLHAQAKVLKKKQTKKNIN
jgi:hypothetical protein